MSDTIEFMLNGKSTTWSGDPMARVLDVLRYDLHLTGAKEGCGEGECGACSILLDGRIVCSCLVPAIQLAGREVGTVEGMAKDDVLDEVQQEFIVAGGVQCGACTPGMVLNVRALLDENPSPTRDQIRARIAGTLCRCTGYERIFRTVESVVAKRREATGGEVA